MSTPAKTGCPIDLELEKDRLEPRLASHCRSVPAQLRPVVDELPRLIHKDRHGERWVDRFSSFTTFFPLMAAEPRNALADAARTACGAQLLLVLAAFLDDRIEDGQLAGDSKQRELLAWLLDRGRGACAQNHRASRRFDQLFESYTELRGLRFCDRPDGTSTRDWRHRLVFGRALLLWIATDCLLCAPELESTREEARSVFDNLYFAIQWLDDLEDVTEDIKNGADNLLIEHARERGVELASATEVLKAGLDVANASGLEHLEIAARLAGGAGMDTLAGEIDRFRARVGQTRDRIQQLRAERLLAALTRKT